MTKIFKQLARHWAVCLVVFALLFVQAYCDLALPDYTSKIVDTGIQQGGIESPLPQTVRQSTLDALSLLMSEEDAQKLQNAYQYYLPEIRKSTLLLQLDPAANCLCWFHGRRFFFWKRKVLLPCPVSLGSLNFFRKNFCRGDNSFLLPQKRREQEGQRSGGQVFFQCGIE